MNKFGYILLVIAVLFAGKKYCIFFFHETLYFISGEESLCNVVSVEEENGKNIYTFKFNDVDYTSINTGKLLEVGDVEMVRTIPIVNKVHFGKFYFIGYLMNGMFFLFLCAILYISIKSIFNS